MPDDIKISALTNVNTLSDTAVFPMVQDLNGTDTTLKASMSQVAGKVAEGTTFVNLTTTAKDLVGAINEAASTGGSVDITTAITTPASIQTFNDGGDNIPLKSLVTEIVPIQSGSGVPSPSNPRAISGHSNCIVTVSDGDSTTRTTTIPLGQTVYGGSLECVEGEGQITHGYLELDGSNDESYSWVPSGSTVYINILVSDLKGGTLDGACNWLQVHNESTQLGVRLGASSTSKYILFDRITENISDVTDLASWRTYLSNHPIQIVYPLATPTSLSVSGANIPTLSGLNNVYTDCGDIQSLEYFNENGNDIDSLVNLETRLSGRIRTKTYTGDGSVPLVVTFDEVPTMILNFFGNGQNSKVITFPFVYGLSSFGGVYVTPEPWTSPTQTGGGHLLYKVAYSNGGKTMTVRASANDAGAHFNQSGDTYTIYYLV